MLRSEGGFGSLFSAEAYHGVGGTVFHFRSQLPESFPGRGRGLETEGRKPLPWPPARLPYQS